MTQDLRLYLDPDGISVWRRRRGEIERIADFPESTDGREAFSHYLENTHKCAFRLLVNREEERYLSETLPLLKRGETRRLAEARSRRAFPDSPWRCQRTARQGMANETKLCLMALDKSLSLADWIGRLQQASSPLTGIYSLAQLLPALLPDKRKPPQLLVLSKHRQRCRLTQLDHGLPGTARWFAGEDAAAPDEIRRLLPAVEEGRALYIIGPPDWPRTLTAISPPRRLPGGDDAATLILSLPDRRWPNEQFAPTTIRASAREQLIRRRCWQLGLLAWLIGAPYSLERQLSWQAQQAVSEREQTALQENRQALASELADIAGSGMSAEQLLQFSADYVGLQGQKQAFADNLSALGQMLDRAPDIQLQRLDWAVPAAAGLARGGGLLVATASLASADALQAGLRLQQFIQTSERPLRILDAPQASAPGEFRFMLEIGTPSP